MNLPSTKSELLSELETRLHWEIQEKARNNLHAFCIYTKPDYQTSWHQRLLCRKLDAFVRGDIKRLMVFQPPRHGKSEHVSRRLPAFILGRNPNAKVITTSYSQDLASAMNRDVQRIIDSPAYHELFPGTRLAEGESGWMRK